MVFRKLENSHSTEYLLYNTLTYEETKYEIICVVFVCVCVSACISVCVAVFAKGVEFLNNIFSLSK